MGGVCTRALDNGEILTVLRLEVDALPALSDSSAVSGDLDEGTATGADLGVDLAYLVTNGWLKKAVNSILSLAFLFKSLQ